LTKILKLSLAIVLLLSCLETGDVGFGSDSAESYKVYTPQGLITWWHCEDDTLDGVGRNDCDDNVLFDEGYLGRGWRFDSAHYLNSPGYDINEAETITLEGWVKPDMLPLGTFIRFITYVGEAEVKAVVRYDGTAGAGTLHFYIGSNGTLHHIWARGVLRVGEFQHFGHLRRNNHASIPEWGEGRRERGRGRAPEGATHDHRLHGGALLRRARRDQDI
jgi:hypothetical protein